MADNKKNNQIKESSSLLDKKNIYNYNDYQKWDNDKHYELIYGRIFDMTPTPSRKHQEISGAIHNIFYNYLINKKCEIYAAPFDVRLPDYNLKISANSNEEKSKENVKYNKNDYNDKKILTVVQPDLSIICDRNKLDDKGCIGAPELIIEIISPNTGIKDRKIKRGLYEKHGVKEYWIVDYHEKTVEVYLLNKKGEYNKANIYGTDDILTTNILPDLKVDLSLIFKNV